MRLRPVPVRVGVGLAMVAWPPAFAPAWTIALASLGAAAVGLAVRRPAAVSVAVGAAIVTCAFAHAGIPALAAEGVLILAYLTGFSKRQLAVGVAATVLVAAGLAVHPGASAWLTGFGLLAAVAAFALAVPARRAHDPGA
jgi:Ca2+/H+ antiporter